MSAGGVTIEQELGTLAGQLNVVNARLTAVTERLLATDDWTDGGCRTPAAYLAWRMGLSPVRAKQVVRVAQHRSQFPKLIAEFDAGQLSLEQVDAAIAAPAWADAKIVDLVKIATVTKIRRAVRSNQFEHDPDAPPVDKPAVKHRVSFGVSRDGHWRLNAVLSIADGQRIQAALEERKDAPFNAGNIEATWLEAFLDCFARSWATIESPARRDQYRTWLHLDTEGDATTSDGWRLPPALRDLLLCDGIIQPVWHHDGIPFSVGRNQRIVPERTRRIIEYRDRGCRVPGCSNTHVEIHHIIHWLDGGTTDTWNLISLCPHHHQLHHQGQLGISGNADRFNTIIFTDAHGQPIPSNGTPIIPTHPPPEPTQPYTPPLAGRFDWNWIGLGWTHPNAKAKHLQQLEQHLAARARTAA